MAEWTPEANEYLDAYLRQVAVLTRSQGDDADEIVSELREHVKRETEGQGMALVTLDMLRKALATVGTPEQVTGIEPALSGARRDDPAATSVVVIPQSSQKKKRIGVVAAFLACSVFIIISIFNMTAMSNARQQARERFALNGLYSIYQAEEALRTSGHDPDNDGIGDYGTLQEMQEKKIFEPMLLNSSDYSFIINYKLSSEGGPSFTCAAMPTRITSKSKSFIINQDGTVTSERSAI